MKDSFRKGNLSEFKGKRVGIDSMTIIYKAHFGCYSQDPIEKVLSQTRLIENYLKAFDQAGVKVS